MGIKWNELVSTDPKAAWSLTSVEIAKEMFKSEMIVVPRIDEAPYFDLMVCFSKSGNKTALEKISNFLKGDYDFHLRGHLTDLLDSSSEGSDLDKVFLACKNSVKADVDQKSMTHEWKSPDGQKEIKIIFHGISRKVINWASLKKGSLIFNSDLHSGSILFIISDVVYASQTCISVKIDGTERSKMVSKKIPVAFSFAELNIDQSGELKNFTKEKELDVAYTFAPANF